MRTHLDLHPTTTEATTTEKLTPDVYITKYVIGRPPGYYASNLTEFKQILADMGNAYVAYKNYTLPRDIASNNVTDDIRLDQESIFFCERRLDVYEKCVQVKFAITIRDVYDKYVFDNETLEDMWNLFADDIFGNWTGGELQTYKDEEGPPKLDKIYVWVAAALGFILFLSTILCFTLFGGNVFQSKAR